MKKILLVFFITFYSFSDSFSIWIPTGEMSPGNTDLVRALTSAANGDLYASSWARGIYKSTNRGVNWTFSGLINKRVSCLSSAPNGDIYGLSITQSFSYIHRSTDNGNTWTDVFTGSFPLNFAGGGAVVFPSDGSIVAAFAVTVGPTIGDVATFVFKSTDSGNNWFQTQVINAGFVGGMIITSDNRILLGTSLAGVVYSPDNGNSFQSLNTFPSIYIKTILKAAENTIYVSDAYGLNRSTDNGLTFTDIGSHSAGVSLRCAAVNSNGDLFIGMDDKKVFHSVNRGDNWTQINEGLAEESYFNTFTSLDGRIFGGTNNSGVMVYDNATQINTVSRIIPEFRLNQNYPNPFNPTTIINYSLTGNSTVSLKIYDILGNEIETLVNEHQTTGNYSLNWNASNQASGIYFYKLIMDGIFSETKKMLLAK